MGPTLSQALAATATLVSLAFACSTLERWLARRRPHEAAWTVSLFLFAAGSAALWVGTTVGWSAWSLRLFYLFGGILNVPFLALGTIYLLGSRRLGDRVAVVLVAVSVYAAGVLTVAPVHGAIDPGTLPTGKEHFGVLPRVFAGVGSGLAALVIIGGAVWSAWRLLRGRGRAGTPSSLPAGRLAAANLLIAAGTLTISAKQLFEHLGDEQTAFAAAVAAGIVLIFAGFLLTNTGPARPAASTGVVGALESGRRPAGAQLSAGPASAPSQPAPAGAPPRT